MLSEHCHKTCMQDHLGNLATLIWLENNRLSVITNTMGYMRCIRAIIIRAVLL